MANPHRGEVSLEAGDKTYMLRFTANAIAKLERKFELPITKIGQKMEHPDEIWIGDLIIILWAALWDSHREVTEDEAGDIMDAAGFNHAANAIGEAFRLAFPQQKAGGKARPRKARSLPRSTS